MKYYNVQHYQILKYSCMCLRFLLPSIMFPHFYKYLFQFLHFLFIANVFSHVSEFHFLFFFLGFLCYSTSDDIYAPVIWARVAEAQLAKQSSKNHRVSDFLLATSHNVLGQNAEVVVP